MPMQMLAGRLTTCASTYAEESTAMTCALYNCLFAAISPTNATTGLSPANTWCHNNQPCSKLFARCFAHRYIRNCGTSSSSPNVCRDRHSMGKNCLWAEIALICSIVCAPLVNAAQFYVSPTGNDLNPGTLGEPFASIGRGQQAASAGDTVWLRGGVYEYVADANDGASEYGELFTKSGTANARINYWAYPGETPIFDFFRYKPTERIRGFSVQADYLHFKGIELRGVQQTITNVNESWGIRVEGSGGDWNIFEQLNLHHNEGPGLFIVNGGNNLVLNSDSHHNYDPDRGGENADGFGSHSNDDGNTFIGNRAWDNSDDGYDFINSPGQVQILDSWAWHNGYVPDTNTAAGNGAGIKAGGFLLDSSRFPPPDQVPTNLVQGNLSFDNRVQGFYANHHPGGIDWINNTAYDNPRGFDLINDVDPNNWPADHYLRNNISYANNSNLFNADEELIDDQFNTWNAGFAASSRDFASFDSSVVDGPRQSDGSLPDIEFMHLAEGSDLIDAGAFVGLEYQGPAPDLGAFEFLPLEPTVPGDVDGNGEVNTADLNIILANFRQSPASWSGGDLTGDGIVNLFDFRAWKQSFDAVVSASAADAARNIPEPATTLLAICLVLLIAMFRSRSAA